MTNALAQNIKVEDNSAALDILMQATNISTQSDSQKSQGFSNIMNNLDSRFQKAQNEFDKKATVSNTSSINQKALNKKEAKEINTTEAIVSSKKNIKEATNNVKVSQKNVEKVTNTTEQTTKAIEKDTVLDDKNLSKETKKVTSNNNSQNLSDINNSSPVESSPVFSSDENEKVIVNEEIKEQLESVLEEVELEAEKLVSTLLVVDENVKVEIKDLKTEIENLLNEAENTQDITQKIEEISAGLNNSNLNQEQKNELTDALEEIKNNLENIESLPEATKEFKDVILHLIDGVEQKDDDNVVLNEVSNLEINVDNKSNTVLTNTFEQSDKTENVQIDTETIKEVVKEIDTLVKDINNLIHNIDGEKLNEVVSKIPETIEKLTNVLDESKVNKISFDEKLVDGLKNLQNILKENIKIDSNKTSEQNKFDFGVKNDVFEVLDKISSDEFKNVDLSNKKEIKDILKVFENLSNNVQGLDLSDDAKVAIETKIQDLMKELSNETVSNEQFVEAVDNLSDEIKVETQKIDTVSLDNENTIDTTNNFNEMSNNDNHSWNEQNSTKENEITFKFNEIESDFPEISEENVQTKTINLKGDVEVNDVQEVEQNLQKTIALDNIMDEMMVEVDIKTIPTQSGALSVSDEVAKLAIGENSSLNPITSAHGSIAYDSTGVNAIIKNAATLMKSAQTQNPAAPSMEDVLNQVTNKITQLKDGVTQKLTMVLRPNDLGRLSIELNTNQNGLSTHIIAQNDDVRAYIEKNIDSLRQQLADAGVNVNSIQIKTAGSEGSTNYEGNQNFQREQNQENLNQQNQQNSHNENHRNNRRSSEIAAQLNNYDMHFAKDFSSVLNKTLNYNLN